MIGDVDLGDFGFLSNSSIAKAHQWELTSTDDVRKSSGTGHTQLYLRKGSFATSAQTGSAHMNLVARRQGSCSFTPTDINSVPALTSGNAHLLDNDAKNLLRQADQYNVAL